MNEQEVIEQHRAAGREFTADGVQSFVRDEGEGEAVVCVHGVPASSFLYRKLLPELRSRGLRGVAFDLPGLGLAARPKDYDYTWTGLGRFAVEAVNALGLTRFHLVVHDIGGPIGLELAAAMPNRIRSLTLLNTMVKVEGFSKPWSMWPFGVRGLGRVWLASMGRPVFRHMMAMLGVADILVIPKAEIDAYIGLLKREDGGAAFLKIMRGFETTAAKEALYRSAIRDVPYPVQIVWGAKDPALTLKRHAEEAREAAGLSVIHQVPGKHFLQEDQSYAIADRIAALARRE